MDLCQVCNQKNAIYTCPRCSFHTCSMICSQSHKMVNSCSGERDKTAHVPMNKYDWNTMTSDYMYLEEVGRKTAEWGLHITRNGLMNRISNRPGRPTRGPVSGRKKEALRLQLQARNIDMEVVAAGMEKSKLNKSFFDAKTKTIFMTVEVLIHSTKSDEYPIRILSHKHKLSSTLDSVVRRSLKEHVKKVPNASIRLAQFVEADDLNFLIAQTSDMLPTNVKTYYRLDPNATLQRALETKTLVEYPTLEVWRHGEFSGVLRDETGELVDVKARIPKDKQSGTRMVSKAITSLLQDYASEDDEDKQEDCLEMLGGYDTDNAPLDDSIVRETENELEDEMESESSEQGLQIASMSEDTLVQLDECLSDNEFGEEQKEGDD